MGSPSSSTMANKEQMMAEIKEAFDLFDRDDSGTIDFNELFICFQALGFDPNGDEIKKMMAHMDEDGNATVEFNEFVDLVEGNLGQKDPTETFKEAYKLFTNGATKVSLTELKNVASELGEACSDAELQEILDECGNGSCIEENDFIEVMKEQAL